MHCEPWDTSLHEFPQTLQSTQIFCVQSAVSYMWRNDDYYSNQSYIHVLMALGTTA